MAATTQVVPVPAAEYLDQAIQGWIVQGYTVANRTPYSVVMVKPKKFEPLWAVIGFLFCVIPLLVYLIVYATQEDQVVEIRVVPPLPPGQGPLSSDGMFRWDGYAWVPN